MVDEPIEIENDNIILPCKLCVLLPKCVSLFSGLPDIIVIKERYNNEMNSRIVLKYTYINTLMDKLLICFTSHYWPKEWVGETQIVSNTPVIIYFHCKMLLDFVWSKQNVNNELISKPILEFFLKLVIGDNIDIKRVTIEVFKGAIWRIEIPN